MGSDISANVCKQITGPIFYRKFTYHWHVLRIDQMMDGDGVAEMWNLTTRYKITLRTEIINKLSQYEF